MLWWKAISLSLRSLHHILVAGGGPLSFCDYEELPKTESKDMRLWSLMSSWYIYTLELLLWYRMGDWLCESPQCLVGFIHLCKLHLILMVSVSKQADALKRSRSHRLFHHTQYIWIRSWCRLLSRYFAPSSTSTFAVLLWWLSKIATS